MTTTERVWWLRFLTNPVGGALSGAALVGMIWALMAGVVRPSDFHVGNTQQVINDKEAMRLYIQETARQTAEEVVKQSDDLWKERLDDLKEQISQLRDAQRWRDGKQISSNPKPRGR